MKNYVSIKPKSFVFCINNDPPGKFQSDRTSIFQVML